MIRSGAYFHDHWLMPELCQLPEYLPSGSVLTLGAGYNALWLASQGFKVTVAADHPAIAEAATGFGLAINFIPGRIREFSPMPQSAYDAVVIQQQLHFLTKKQVSDLVSQLKRYTVANGFHVICVGGDPEPRVSDPTKESLLPWLEWYSDWRILQFTYRDDDIGSRHAESSHRLFGHQTTLIAQKETPAQRQLRLVKPSVG
jgi:hypothetical protein